MRVDVLVYDGFDELDAVGPFEVFASAADLGADLTVSLASETDRETVTAGHGLRVSPDVVLPAPDSGDRPDVLVVPGGGWTDPDSPGAGAEARRGVLPDVVAAHHEAGATLAAVCTGGMLLAAAGLLDGRPAVTHTVALGDLRETGASVVDARVVDDGDVLTAGGVTSGLDLALYLVEREVGVDTADSIATRMEYERRGPVHT
jgi:transcriptional regulator GlxA family with amidase domain